MTRPIARCIPAVLAAAAVLAPAASARAEAPRARFAEVRLSLEAGFLAPVSHTIQYGKNGTRFDYVDEGGQDTLFFFARLSAELHLARRHAIIFLYQPLDLRGDVTLRRDVLIDEQLFASGTALNLRYGFDFYRLSYLYDLARRPGREVALGGSLQIRNAAIVFSTPDGSLRRSYRNIGPVPTLKARLLFRTRPGFFYGGEIDFMYAPVKYLNGGRSDVQGAIVDASLRAGYRFRPGTDLFVNLRYLGGGAEGTSPSAETLGDGWVSNWLHFMTVSLGVTWQSGP
jgi:hypothetical protein